MYIIKIKLKIIIIKKQHNSTILTNKQNINLYKFSGILNKNEMIKNYVSFICQSTV